MLLVISTAFVKNLVNERPDPSGVYEQLKFSNYPTPPQSIILATEFHAIGEVKGILLVRARSGENPIGETSSNLIDITAAGGQPVNMTFNLKSLVFPCSGEYDFDIMFNGAILRSATLTLV